MEKTKNARKPPENVISKMKEPTGNSKLISEKVFIHGEPLIKSEGEDTRDLLL